MTSIVFRNFRSNDMERSFSLEDAYQRYGAWGGIHAFDFNTLLEIPSQAVTGTGSVWTLLPIATGLPANFTVRYHKYGVSRQGIGITSEDSSINLVVGGDDLGYPSVWWEGVLAQQVPTPTPIEADVEVVFRQQVLSDDDSNIWLSVTVYMNGAWVTTYSRKLTDTAGNLSVSLGAFASDVVTYTQIVVPELCETAEFGTLDPGETAYSGFQRTIEGRYLYSMVRFDGSLRAWRKKQRPLAYTFAKTVGDAELVTDLSQLVTYARMMGAYTWSEAVDWDMLRGYGDRFAEINNSTLLTEEECQVEAVNGLKRSQESCFGKTFEAQHVPLLEPEDRVQVEGEDWVLNDYTLSVSPGAIQQTYNVRQYVWGS